MAAAPVPTAPRLRRCLRCASGTYRCGSLRCRCRCRCCSRVKGGMAAAAAVGGESDDGGRGGGEAADQTSGRDGCGFRCVPVAVVVDPRHTRTCTCAHEHETAVISSPPGAHTTHWAQQSSTRTRPPSHGRGSPCTSTRNRFAPIEVTDVPLSPPSNLHECC